MVSWVTHELLGADFHDLRLTERLLRIVERFAARPAASIPHIGDAKAEATATYRFFANPAVTVDAILQPHRLRTAQRAAEHPLVLVAQDTTEINLTTHDDTAGLGYLSDPQSHGLLLHNLLCISPAGVPLGVLDQRAWVRPKDERGKRKTRNQRLTQDKESQRWLDGLASVEQHLAAHPHVVLVSDRESDIYDLFVAPRAANVDLLVRVRDRKRRVEHPAKHLGAAVANSPAKVEITLEIPRADDRPRRTATLTLRWLTLTICRPANHRGIVPTTPLQLTVLEAREEQPPEGVEPVVWLLATTLTIANVDDALRILRWYTFRWLIERLHFVLKSGCGAERHQLGTKERCERLLATLTIVAWHVLQLMYEARREPEAVCTRVLTSDEWHVLHWQTQRRAPLPPTAPSIRTALRQIAQLGGFLARKRDGEPGVRTIWRGLRRLNDLTLGYRLARDHPLTSCEDCGEG